MNPEKAFVKEVLERPEWNVALAEHAETLERNPRDFRAWEAIGDLYTEAGKGDQALMVYEELLGGLEEEGRHLEALVVAQKMWRAKPQKVGLLKRIGELYLRQGLLVGGVHYLWRYALEKQKRRQLEPFLRTCDQIAQASASEEVRKQVESLKRTLEALRATIPPRGTGEPPSVKLPPPEATERIKELHALGAEHFRKGFWETARKTFGKILTLYPYDLEALKMRLEIGLKTRDEQEIGTAILRLAETLQAIGQGAEAEEALRKISDKYPRLKEVRRRLEGSQRPDVEAGFTALSQGIVLLGHLLDTLPFDGGASYLDLGVLYRQAGLLEPAKEEFQRAMSDPRASRRAREELSLLGVSVEGEPVPETTGPEPQPEPEFQAPPASFEPSPEVPPQENAPEAEKAPPPPKRGPAIDKRIGFV